eukprot:3520827-Amphidinium_carterae.1
MAVTSFNLQDNPPARVTTCPTSPHTKNQTLNALRGLLSFERISNTLGHAEGVGHLKPHQRPSARQIKSDQSI